jgi:uncharacterized membrane protein
MNLIKKLDAFENRPFIKKWRWPILAGMVVIIALELLVITSLK